MQIKSNISNSNKNKSNFSSIPKQLNKTQIEEQQSLFYYTNFLNDIYKSQGKQNKYLVRNKKQTQKLSYNLSSQFKKTILGRNYLTQKKNDILNQEEHYSKKTLTSKKKENIKTLPNSIFQQYGLNKRDKLITLNRLKSQLMKTSNSQQKKIVSKQKSQGKKGLHCTLFQKSLQKSHFQKQTKLSKKLISFKSIKDHTNLNENKIIQFNQQKETKKILLKKRNAKNVSSQNTSFFHFITLQQKQKQNQPKQLKSTLKKNCNTQKKISKEFSQLKLNLSLLKQSTSNNLKPYQSTKTNKWKTQSNQLCKIRVNRCQSSNNKSSKQNSIGRKIKSRQKSDSKLSNLNEYEAPKAFKSENDSNTKSLTSDFASSSQKKITINDKIKSNLQKIHSNYKFVLNYVNDFWIIGRLNRYELGGEEECKWALLLIDEVYEMIKHSQQTKLKGLEHSRDYKFREEDEENNKVSGKTVKEGAKEQSKRVGKWRENKWCE